MVTIVHPVRVTVHGYGGISTIVEMWIFFRLKKRIRLLLIGAAQRLVVILLRFL